MSETCPASQGRGEGYSVRTDESEGLTFSKVSISACQPGGDASRWGFLLSGQKKPKPA